ncbi:MAG TPA: ABC transporter permease [Candidatus Bathyarchaeia archaeon]|nr:ABC transporter permease [Candidatus Bathyarchaeia archaeon]
MAIKFYLESTFRNIWTYKRQTAICFLGILISISVITSLSVWSTTSENTVIKDFLEDQDFEIKARSYLTSRLPDIKDWLDNNDLVESTHYIYYNLAFFNVEDKSPFYRFWPLDAQDDMNDPATISTLFLITNDTVKRFASQFTVRGEFDLKENEVLISESQAYQIEQAMNITVTPGTVLNLTIARNSVDFGVYVFQYEPVHFYNITIRGIYSRINTITTLQESFSNDFIDNSIIFLQENMFQDDLERMEDNGLYPLLVAKCKSDELIKDGIDQIMPKLMQLSEYLTIDISTALVTILNTPLENIQQTFSKAKTTLVILAPVAMLGIILSLVSSNIILEKRKLEISIYQEKCGQRWQIIGSLLIEFSIVSLIAIIIGILISVLLAAFIPAIASQELTYSNYSYFLHNLNIKYWPIAVSAAAIFSITIIYTIIKVNKMVSLELSERDLTFRAKLQKGIAIGFLGLITLAAIIVFIVLTIIFQKNSSNAYSFSNTDTKNSSLLFILLSFIIVLVAILLAIGIFELLGKMKGFYNVFMKRNSLFLINNLKHSKYKFNTLIIVVFIITASTIYSITILDTLQKTSNAYQYYNNGSDLRIKTLDTSYTYQDTLASIDGIEAVMPILQTSGKYGAETVTVIGINASIYAELGRWDSSSIPNNNFPSEYSDYLIADWMSDLKSNINGSIISDFLANKYEIPLADDITITTLPIGVSYGVDHFVVKGIFHSAPGLGLLSGVNIDLNQPNDHIMIVNLEKIIDFYYITTTNLFFAKILPDANLDLIIEELSTLNIVVEVNPSLVSKGFGERYVNNYVPSTEIFLIAQIILTNLIGIIIIANTADFILDKRKQESAILKAFGNTDRNFVKLIYSELFLIDFTAILFGSAIGISSAFITTLLMVPFFEINLILPMQFSTGYLYLIIFIVYLISFSFIAVIPSIIKLRRVKIAENIKDETASAY